MILQDFEMLMRQNGYQYHARERMALGIEDKYPVKVQWMSNKILQASIGITKQQWKLVSRPLKVELKQVKGGCTYLENRVNISISTPKDGGQDVFGRSMGIALGVLKEYGVQPSQTCPLCHQAGGCDVAMLYQNAYVPAHRDCLERQVTTTLSEAEKNDVEGNYITGLIGGIVGAVVGIIPSLCSIILMDSIFGLLYALIPMCIYFGYRLFRGKMNRMATYITIALSIFSVYLIEISLTLYSFLYYGGMSVSRAFSRIGKLLLRSDYWAGISVEALSSFLFVLIGIAMAWRFISRTSQTSIAGVQNTAETATAYPQYQRDEKKDIS